MSATVIFSSGQQRAIAFGKHTAKMLQGIRIANLSPPYGQVREFNFFLSGIIYVLPKVNSGHCDHLIYVHLMKFLQISRPADKLFTETKSHFCEVKIGRSSKALR